MAAETLVGRQSQRANAKPSLIRKFCFIVELEKQIQFFSGGVFQVLGFLFSPLSFHRRSFRFILSSRWHSPLRENWFQDFSIHFLVSISFDLFCFVVSVFVRGWFHRFSKLACFLFAKFRVS